MTPLAAFNALPTPAAEAHLLTLCGSPAWARQLAALRPFATPEALLARASTLWFAQPEPEWLAAFACHPRIGERPALPGAFSTSSSHEQAAALATLAPVQAALAHNNRLYESRFGFLYLVFANGRSAPQLLALLEHRLTRTRPEELAEAVRQQDAITHLRLTRWLEAQTLTTRISTPEEPHA